MAAGMPELRILTGLLQEGIFLIRPAAELQCVTPVGQS
jgi:hypothetical protein